MTMKKVSIVLPTYNGERYIEQAIQSVLAQTYQNFELIIVDDCSTDGTAYIVQRYVDQDSRVQVIHNTENQKLPRSLNIGFRHAAGDCFTWTSDDNRYKPTALERMLEYLEADQETGLVYANMDYINEDGCKTGTFSLDAKKLYRMNCIGACFLYRRSVAEQIGEYDSSMFLVEDYDYWLRISREYKILHIPQNLYQYRIHNDSLTMTKKQAIMVQLYKLRMRELDFILERAGEDERAELFLNMWVYGGNDVWQQKDRFFPGGILPLSLKWMERLARTGNRPDEQKMLILFGAGNYGKLALNDYGKNRVYAFADNNNLLHGTCIEGVPVISFNQLREVYKDYQIVLSVGIKNAVSLAQQLERAGIENFILYTNA